MIEVVLLVCVLTLSIFVDMIFGFALINLCHRCGRCCVLFRLAWCGLVWFVWSYCETRRPKPIQEANLS